MLRKMCKKKTVQILFFTFLFQFKVEWSTKIGNLITFYKVLFAIFIEIY